MFASIYCVLYLHLALNLWLHAEFHIPYGSHSRLKKCFPACLFTNEKRLVFFELGNQIMIFLGDFSHFQFFWVYQNVTFEFLFVADDVKQSCWLLPKANRHKSERDVLNS